MKRISSWFRGSAFLIAALGGLLIGGALGPSGGLLAQAPTGVIRTSPVVVPGSFNYNGGPQTSVVPSSGGTFTCTSSGTITVANANVTANSIVIVTVKTAASPGATPFIATITPGTGYTITCASGDTSVYNYIVLG
jgi:hypothetical protein